MRNVKTAGFVPLAALLLAGCAGATTATPRPASRGGGCGVLAAAAGTGAKSAFDGKERSAPVMTAKLLSTSIHVFDMDGTLSFFHGILGLPVLQRFALEGADIAILGVEGQPSLSFIARPAYAEMIHQGFSVAVETASLDEMLDKIKEAGYSVTREPFSPQPGSRLCFVEGPAGIQVELIEPQR